MKIFSCNAELISYIPNVITSVEGEQTLFDKIRPQLVAAEQWLIDTFTSEDVLDAIIESGRYELEDCVATVVACEAMTQAIPSLDLVLTTNGFGVVSNSNIAPASKERVERLLNTLEANRDKSISLLLTYLPKIDSWRNTKQYKYFHETIFPDFQILATMGIKEHRWDKYQELHAQILMIEQKLAAKYFSPELIAKWHGLSKEDALQYNTMVSTYQAIIVFALKNNELPDLHIADMVNTIRENRETYPEWHNSETAKLFSPPIFENKKKSTGYWW